MYILKEKPEDFKVKEIINFKTKNKGKYAYFLLKKRNWTTLKALQKIAAQLNINVNSLKSAGTKDRDAVTEQYVSACNIKKSQLENLKIKDLELKFVGYNDFPIHLGQLKGNEFVIKIRNFDKPVSCGKDFVFPNYFGEQRFGGTRSNTHMIGKEILLGNYAEAAKVLLTKTFPEETDEYKAFSVFAGKNWGCWGKILEKTPHYLVPETMLLRSLSKKNDFFAAFQNLPKQLFTMYVHAYQSFLWNKTLSKFIAHNFEHETAPFQYGGLNFLKNAQRVDNFKIPMARQNVKSALKELNEVLAEEGADLKNFNQALLSKHDVLRNAFEKTKNFRKTEYKNREQTVSFFLPRGSYATVAIEQLIRL